MVISGSKRVVLFPPTDALYMYLQGRLVAASLQFCFNSVSLISPVLGFLHSLEITTSCATPPKMRARICGERMRYNLWHSLGMINKLWV